MDTDRLWETLQEQASVHFLSSDFDKAVAILEEALSVARKHFDAQDLRIATSLANLACLKKRGGDTALAEAMFRESLALWDACEPWLDAIKTRQRARSSTFHYRLEARHWEAYQALGRQRLTGIADEGRYTLKALAEGRPVGAPAATDWETEKKLPRSDVRNLMAAILLIFRLEEETNSA